MATAACDDGGVILGKLGSSKTLADDEDLDRVLKPMPVSPTLVEVANMITEAHQEVSAKTSGSEDLGVQKLKEIEIDLNSNIQEAKKGLRLEYCIETAQIGVDFENRTIDGERIDKIEYQWVNCEHRDASNPRWFSLTPETLTIFSDNGSIEVDCFKQSAMEPALSSKPFKIMGSWRSNRNGL